MRVRDQKLMQKKQKLNEEIVDSYWEVFMLQWGRLLLTTVIAIVVDVRDMPRG